MNFLEINIQTKIKRTLYFLLGNLLYALALNLFLVDNNIAAGGFTGIATVINYIIPIPIGLVTLLLNMPFFVLSIKIRGWKFTGKTIIGVMTFSLFIDMTAWIPVVTDDMLVAAVFGGFMYGVGASFLVRSDYSVGGTDLVSRLLLAKFKGFSIGKLMLLVDGSVVVLAIIVFQDIRAGLFAIITLYTCSVIADKSLSRLDYASLCFIITEQSPRIMANALMDQLVRGVTVIEAQGMYQSTSRNILMIVVRQRETYRVKEIISSIDDMAFVVVAHANEVCGCGFKDLVQQQNHNANVTESNKNVD